MHVYTCVFVCALGICVCHCVWGGWSKDNFWGLFLSFHYVDPQGWNSGSQTCWQVLVPSGPSCLSSLSPTLPFMVLEIRLRAFSMLGECSVTELIPSIIFSC